MKDDDEQCHKKLLQGADVIDLSHDDDLSDQEDGMVGKKHAASSSVMQYGDIENENTSDEDDEFDDMSSEDNNYSELGKNHRSRVKHMM